MQLLTKCIYTQMVESGPKKGTYLVLKQYWKHVLWDFTPTCYAHANRHTRISCVIKSRLGILWSYQIGTKHTWLIVDISCRTPAVPVRFPCSCESWHFLGWSSGQQSLSHWCSPTPSCVKRSLPRRWAPAETRQWLSASFSVRNG